MKKNMMIKALFAACAVLFAACASEGSGSSSSGGGGESGGGSTTGVTSVTLNHTTRTLVAGLNNYNTVQLEATVNGTDLSDEDKGVVWSSSSDGVATVSSDGLVTAVAAGNATITAKSTKDTTKTAACAVTVVSSDASTTLWRADDYPEQTISSSTNLGIMTVLPSDSKTITIDGNSKSIDGYTFSKRLKFGGSGSTTSMALKFTTSSSATITVYYISGSSGNSRKLVLADSSGAEVASGTNDGTAIASFATTGSVAAGTYYIYSANSGINVYGVKIESDTPATLVPPTGITLDKTSLALDLDSDTDYQATLTATLTPDDVSSSLSGIEWKSSEPSVATVADGVVTGISAGSATITASTITGNYQAVCTVTVTGDGKAIRASDAPTGWASYTGATYFDTTTQNTPPDNAKGTVGGYGASSSKIYTVSTKAALKSALSGTDKKIIYIDGMIDMTDGMLPSTAKGSTDALDTWIKTEAAKLTNTSTYGDVASKVTSLSTWKSWYAAGNTNTADETGVYKNARSSLADTYANVIKLTITSNTTLIGLTDESGIKGGCIKISSISNVVIRNLILQDSFDPFPQIEKGDGFNANYDGIEISSSKYIWIDHCSIQDSIATTDDDFDHIELSDGEEKKYQVFDGLLDIKKASDFVTVSYCKFANHDKTTLIGHDANYTEDRNHQTITMHHNYYYNCKQRLPMVRFATIHIYNNFYTAPGGRGNSYCIGLREENRLYAENNYFDTNVTPISNSDGNYYFIGNSGQSNTGSAYWTPSQWYSYTAESADNAKTSVLRNAGAGVWAVKK